MPYDYDIVVIGGGPAGYAGAIRAGPAQEKGPLRRARQARRDLPELGVHPHQGPLDQRPPGRADQEPRRTVRIQRPADLGLRPDDSSQPQRRRQVEQGDRGAFQEVQGRVQVRSRQGRRAEHRTDQRRDGHCRVDRDRHGGPAPSLAGRRVSTARRSSRTRRRCRCPAGRNRC